jgi:hypothetical protein
MGFIEGGAVSGFVPLIPVFRKLERKCHMGDLDVDFRTHKLEFKKYDLEA